MWLDEDEGDGLIERELYEMVSLRQRKQKSEFIFHPKADEDSKRITRTPRKSNLKQTS